MDRNITLGAIFEAKIDNLMAGIKTVEASLKRIGALTKEVSQVANANIRDFEKEIKNTSQETKGLAEYFERIVEKMGEQAIFAAAATALYSIASAAKACITEIIQFDQALANLQAISGATASEIAVMAKAIIDVARVTKFSTTEIAEGMVLLTQSGFSASEAIDAIKATANLATGTLADMQDAADLLTTTLASFGLNAKESVRVADVWANAIDKSKLTVEKLRIAMNYVGTTAAEAGMSLEEMAASMMVMADHGSQASTIGTGLRQVIAKLISPNEKLAASLMASGVALDEMNPRLVGMDVALTNLASLLWDSEKAAVDMGKAYDYFGLRGAQAAAILVKSFATGSDYDEALRMVKETGTSAEMAGIQAEGLAVKFKNLADRATILAGLLGQAGVGGLLHFVADGLKKATEWAEVFLASNWGKMTVQIGLLASGVHLIVTAVELLNAKLMRFAAIQAVQRLIALGQYANAANAAFTALAAGVQAVLTPLNLIIVAVGAAVYAINVLINANRKAAESAAAMSINYKNAYESLEYFNNTLKEIQASGSLTAHEDAAQAVARFAEQFPDLAKEVRSYADVADIASLSTEELSAILDKMAMDKLENQFASAAESLRRYEKEVNRAAAINYDVLGQFFVSDADVERAQQTYRDQLDQTTRTLTEFTTKWGWSRDRVIAYIGDMGKSANLSGKQIQAMSDKYIAEMDRIESTSARTLKIFKTAIERMPDSMRAAYEEMDAVQKVDFVKFQKDLDAKASAYEKTARTLKITEEDRIKSLAALRAEEYADYFIANSKMENDTRTREEKVLGVVADFMERAKQLYAENVITRKEYEGQIAGYMEVANETYVSGIKQTYEKAAGTLEKYIDSLKTRFDQLKGQVEGINSEIKGEYAAYADALRNIQQKTMTDEERWLDDRAEANRLLNEGIEQGNKDMVKKASVLFQSLARDVKDENGNAVMDIKDTASLAAKGMEDAFKATIDILEKQKNAFQTEMEMVRGQIAQTEKNLESYRQKVLTVSSIPLTLNTDQVNTELDKIAAKVMEFRRGLTAAETAEVKVAFTGHGSSEKPLSEKTDEMAQKIRDFVKGVEDNPPEVKTDFSSVTQELNILAATARVAATENYRLKKSLSMETDTSAQDSLVKRIEENNRILLAAEEAKNAKTLKSAEAAANLRVMRERAMQDEISAIRAESAKKNANAMRAEMLEQVKILHQNAEQQKSIQTSAAAEHEGIIANIFGKTVGRIATFFTDWKSLLSEEQQGWLKHHEAIEQETDHHNERMSLAQEAFNMDMNAMELERMDATKKTYQQLYEVTGDTDLLEKVKKDHQKMMIAEEVKNATILKDAELAHRKYLSDMEIFQQNVLDTQVRFAQKNAEEYRRLYEQTGNTEYINLWRENSKKIIDVELEKTARVVKSEADMNEIRTRKLREFEDEALKIRTDKLKSQMDIAEQLGMTGEVERLSKLIVDAEKNRYTRMADILKEYSAKKEAILRQSSQTAIKIAEGEANSFIFHTGRVIKGIETFYDRMMAMSVAWETIGVAGWAATTTEAGYSVFHEITEIVVSIYGKMAELSLNLPSYIAIALKKTANVLKNNALAIKITDLLLPKSWEKELASRIEDAAEVMKEGANKIKEYTEPISETVKSWNIHWFAWFRAMHGDIFPPLISDMEKLNRAYDKGTISLQRMIREGAAIQNAGPRAQAGLGSFLKGEFNAIVGMIDKIKAGFASLGRLGKMLATPITYPFKVLYTLTVGLNKTLGTTIDLFKMMSKSLPGETIQQTATRLKAMGQIGYDAAVMGEKKLIDFSRMFKAVWEGIKKAALAGVDLIKNSLVGLKNYSVAWIRGLGQNRIIGTVAKWVEDIFRVVIRGITYAKGYLSTFLKWISPTVTRYLAVITPVLTKIGAVALRIFNVFGVIMAAVDGWNIGRWIGNIQVGLIKVDDIIQTMWADVDILGKHFGIVWESIKMKVKEIGNVIIGVIPIVRKFFRFDPTENQNAIDDYKREIKSIKALQEDIMLARTYQGDSPTVHQLNKEMEKMKEKTTVMQQLAVQQINADNEAVIAAQMKVKQAEYVATKEVGIQKAVLEEKNRFIREEIEANEKADKERLGKRVEAFAKADDNEYLSAKEKEERVNAMYAAEVENRIADHMKGVERTEKQTIDGVEKEVKVRKGGFEDQLRAKEEAIYEESYMAEGARKFLENQTEKLTDKIIAEKAREIAETRKKDQDKLDEDAKTASARIALNQKLYDVTGNKKYLDSNKELNEELINAEVHRLETFLQMETNNEEEIKKIVEATREKMRNDYAKKELEAAASVAAQKNEILKKQLEQDPYNTELVEQIKANNDTILKSEYEKNVQILTQNAQTTEEITKAQATANDIMKKQASDMNKDLAQIAGADVGPAFAKAMAGVKVVLADYTEEQKTAVSKAQAEYMVFYNNLDAMRKLDFRKMVESTQQQVEEFEKSAARMGLSEEEKSATINRIRKDAFDQFKKQVEDEQKAVAESSLESVLKKIEEKTQRLQQASQDKLDAYQEELSRLEIMQQEAETKFYESQLKGKSVGESAFFKSLKESVGNLSDLSEQELDVIRKSNAEKYAAYTAGLSEDQRFALGKKAFEASLKESVGNLSDMSAQEIEAIKQRNIQLAAAYQQSPKGSPGMTEADLQASMTYADKIRAVQLKMSEERVTAIRSQLGLQETMLDQFADKENSRIAETLGAKKKALSAETAETKTALTMQEKLNAEYAIERANMWAMNPELAKKNGIDMVQIEKEANEALNLLYQENTENRKKSLEESLDIQEDVSDGAAKVQKDYAREVEGIDRAVLEKKKEMYRQAKDALQKELQDSLAMEKQIAEEIKNVRKSLADEQMSTEEKIRDLKRGTMTEQQAYNDKWAEINEKIAKADAMSNAQYEEKTRLLKEAKDAAAGMATEIKEGDKVLVSKEASTKKAISAIEDIQKKMVSVSDARVQVLEKAQAETEKNSDSIKNAMEETNGMLEAIGHVIDDKVKKGLAEAAEEARDLMEELSNPVELDINTEKTRKKFMELVALKDKLSKQGETGASVAMAGGGEVPGSGDGDTVPAMLTPGEYVIPKPVVKSFGVDFFHFLRSLQNAGRERITSALSTAAARIKGYAQGGLVMPEFRFALPQMPSFAPVQHFAAGGPVMAAAGAPHYGTVNLTVGGSSYKMWSDEETARSLMRALTKEQRKKPNG